MELPWALLALAGMGAAADLARLPYVPHVPPMALLGKVTATTFVLERPCCVFDGHAEASDAVWLAVAFANASATFRNPQSRADVPLYHQLPTAHSYMTLETAAAAFSCGAASPAVLRVGSDTACGEQAREDPCNGPLPSPGPYRVKFLLMGCSGPKAETRWSEPILLRRAVSPSTIEPVPARPGSAVVVISSILASLGAVLATAVLGALGAKVWGSLRHQGLGTDSFIRRSYRTHHIPPGLPQPLPPGCGCSPPGLCCSAPQPPAPCQRIMEQFRLDGTIKGPPRLNPAATGRATFQ
ncbi:uroplakin-3b-like isoform X2 [Taeniopygia guttata]|uniref:uroplakin-3b-like isoform X2 n=1 Tax=Taeniopygia guttata TaxID=59729 RepID=UPI003BB8DF83